VKQLQQSLKFVSSEVSLSDAAAILSNMPSPVELPVLRYGIGLIDVMSSLQRHGKLPKKEDDKSGKTNSVGKAS